MSAAGVSFKEKSPRMFADLEKNTRRTIDKGEKIDYNKIVFY